MALVDCPECGDRISTISPQCPNCGHVLSEDVAAIRQDADGTDAPRPQIERPSDSAQAQPRSQSNWVVAGVVAAIVAAILAVVAAAVILAGSLTIANPFEDRITADGEPGTTIVTTAAGDDGLAVGECIDDDQLGYYSAGDDFTTTSCDHPHDNEVYYVHWFLPGPFPGDDAVSDELADVCSTEFETYVGRDYASSSLAVYRLWPGEDLWESGGRAGECLLFDVDREPLTGSAYQSGW